MTRTGPRLIMQGPCPPVRRLQIGNSSFTSGVQRWDRYLCLVVPSSEETSDWKFLVHFWSSEMGQRRSGIGVASRAQQLVLHTAGTQCFAIVREKMEEELGVDSIGNIHIFDATHRSKMGYFQPLQQRISCPRPEKSMMRSLLVPPSLLLLPPTY